MREKRDFAAPDCVANDGAATPVSVPGCGTQRRRTQPYAACREGRYRDAPVAAAAPRFEALLCPSCGAPQPAVDADSVVCSACGTTVSVPAEQKLLRDAHRMSAADAAQLDERSAQISRPPAAWERVAIVVGYGIGITTVVILAIGALVGAIGGAIAGDKMGDTMTKILAGLGAIVCGFVSVPFAGEWVIAFLGHFDFDAASTVVMGARTHLSADLTVAAVLYFLGIAPIALAWRTSQKISGLEDLQARLSAKPPATAGGTSSCRRCGAPLDVKPGALATRCGYCGADNLLTVPHAYAKKKKDEASELDVQVRAAVDTFQRTKRDDRQTMWLLLAGGTLVAPLLCVSGWVMHKIFAA